ncbi:homoserine O-acetyltransferase [uncultured Alistipes sp.]|uniref:homoserine O-acetyltransferase family protein n=1 Tax=uncultured Alistipes sp. TaxID=538949 RepID=UPI00272AC8AD|nr:homoserine O-acetyltransferase [uncultured Alistipes sp.]MCX4302222.1 homoserine O-acetyltransferase [Alistipes sp.]
MIRYYDHNAPFELESGAVLPALRIAFHTYGELNAARDNTVWVCHALTASSDVADWWPHTVGEGRFLDPSRHFVVCANILGSHYGTTGPLHTDPATGRPYYGSFPAFTIRDMVRAHRLLADALGIRKIRALVGSSVGGFQAVEWAVAEPERFGRLALIATAAKASPWAIAIDETQRMAIEADATFGEPRDDAGMAGLAAARAIGLLTYRGAQGYNLTQQDPDEYPARHRAATYQQYQGEKLCRRYNAYSYHAILNAFDTHDIGRGRGGVVRALERIAARTMVVGIATDMIFPPAEMRRLQAMIPRSEYREIYSPFGHDGFLVEHERLDAILRPFING